jgi:hypothetical protein
MINKKSYPFKKIVYAVVAVALGIGKGSLLEKNPSCKSIISSAVQRQFYSCWRTSFL